MRFDMAEAGGRWPEGKPTDLHPLIHDRLKRPRSIFAPHQRLRMNVLPMFLNLFVPWGVFVFCMVIASSQLRYSRPTVAGCLIALMVIFWLLLVLASAWARQRDPDPTWFTHFALAVGVAWLVGTYVGEKNYSQYTKPYHEVIDLKVARDIDASTMPGRNVMDAGIVHFSPGSQFHPRLSWHFKRGSLYCVAPIVSNTSAVPLSQTYDFWAVGKDCCSISASDFRCGSWGNVGQKGGVRVVDSGTIANYRLAVRQAESLYDIMAPDPIFVEWYVNPELEVRSWNQTVFKSCLSCAAFAFVVSLFSTAMFTCRVAWLGRGESVYDTDFYGDVDWRYGPQGPVNWNSQYYRTN